MMLRRFAARVLFYGLCVVTGLLLATCLTAQTPRRGIRWRTALTAAANASLWIDYCQFSYAIDHHVPTSILGAQPTKTRLALYNGAELVVNSFAPRRFRPWINAITLGFHIVAIRNASRWPVGILQMRRGQEVVRIGVRFWP